MTETPSTVRRVLADETRRRREFELRYLLDGLRQYMGVYARSPEEQQNLPELAFEWLENPCDPGPGQMIMQAIAENPELWSHALPNDVVIVEKKILENLVGPGTSHILAQDGAARVINHSLNARQRRLTP